MISTTTCSAVIVKATARFASTISTRLTGAARRSRRAPVSRSVMTPMPENMQFNGIRRPMVPMAAKLM